MTKPTYEELQAQVERLQNLILEVINTDADEFFMMGTDWGVAAIASLSETPAQSLAALKAQWQAEAVHDFEAALSSFPITAEDWINNNAQDIKCGCKTESDEKFGTLIYKCKQHDDSITANANTGANK